MLSNNDDGSRCAILRQQGARTYRGGKETRPCVGRTTIVPEGLNDLLRVITRDGGMMEPECTDIGGERHDLVVGCTREGPLRFFCPSFHREFCCSFGYRKLAQGLELPCFSVWRGRAYTSRKVLAYCCFLLFSEVGVVSSRSLFSRPNNTNETQGAACGALHCCFVTRLEEMIPGGFLLTTSTGKRC